MTVTAPTPTGTGTAAASTSGYANLGIKDFIKLMTKQLESQDPTSPVDNTQMIAQMAQFSSLSGINDMSATLKSIAGKLDAVLAAQNAAQNATKSPATTATAA